MANTLKSRVERRVQKKQVDVFTPKDFAKLGGEDQVLRALRTLTREQKLVRLGYGIYARARKSELSGRVVLANPQGLLGVARQALDCLNVKWELTESQRAYNEGKSTQIPVNPVIRVKGRFSRKLRYGTTELIIEHAR